MKEKTGSVNNAIVISRIIDGSSYRFELTPEEIERVFRYQDMCYMTEDAKRHLLEYVDYDEEDEALKAEFKERFGVDFDFLINDRDTLEYLAEQFSEESDCNVAENNTWDYVIENYLNEIKREAKDLNEPTRVVKATFISIWDGGTEIATHCEVNLETKEVFNIEKVDTCNGVDCLDGEFVKIGDELFGVCSEEDAETALGAWYWYR